MLHTGWRIPAPANSRVAELENELPPAVMVLMYNRRARRGKGGLRTHRDGNPRAILKPSVRTITMMAAK